MNFLEISIFPLKSPVYVFFLIITIILFAPIVARKLKVPDIIIYIITGILIGPHGFKIIDYNSGIELLATVGLIYIMFLAALELDLSTFKKNKHKSIIFGLYTFFIPLTIGFIITYYFFNYELKSALLIASIFSTHTLIAYPIVSKYGITKEEGVGIVVGGTIITDTLVLLLLAIVCKHNNSENTFFLYSSIIINLILLIIFSYLIIPKLSKWFFKNYDYEKNYHFIYVLFIVFLCSSISYLIGTEPIIGAFIAGILLNPTIPSVSILRDRLKFIGLILFFPFFVINVGMHLNFNSFINNPEVFKIITILITAFLTKWLAAFLTQITFKLHILQRNLIFGLSSAHAIATIAVLTVGNNAGIIEDNFLNIGIIIILTSCLFSAIIIEKTSKKILLYNKLHQKSENNYSEIQTINISFSNPHNIEKLIDLATLIPKSLKDTKFYLSTIVLENENIDKELNEKRTLIEETISKTISKDINITPLIKIDLSISGGILRLNKEIETDILILGISPKKNFVDSIFGNILDSLIQKFSRNIIICNLVNSLNLIKKIEIIIPSDFSLEKDSKFILQILSNISKNLTSEVVFHTTGENDKRFISKYIDIHINNFVFNNVNDINYFIENIKKDNEDTKLYIFVTPRPENITYKNHFDEFPHKLIKNIKNKNFLVLYFMKPNK